MALCVRSISGLIPIGCCARAHPMSSDFKQGGGVPYRQGPHQVDTVRLLGGGLVRSVRAQTGDWMKERPIPGYYAAFLEFENGVPATIVHNGYGYFVASELVPWGEDKSIYDASTRSEIRRQLRAGTRDETTDKQSIRIGGSREKEYFYDDGSKPWMPEDMGLAIASLDRADLRQSKFGLFVHDDTGKHDLDVVPGLPNGNGAEACGTRRTLRFCHQWAAAMA